jgi:hypothetical protein
MEAGADSANNCSKSTFAIESEDNSRMGFPFKLITIQRLFHVSAAFMSGFSITVIAALSLLGLPRKDESWQTASRTSASWRECYMIGICLAQMTQGCKLVNTRIVKLFGA